MKVSLTDAGKRFNRDWIFRHFNYNFEEGRTYAITGPNGSGKSTLLQTIGGSMMASEGKISYSSNGSAVNNDQVYNHISFCAPYLEVVEEMTLKELFHFHQRFKKLLPGVTVEKIISIVGLEKAANRQIRYYSSGMKQRVKLAQCIFSDTPVVLLDEPCTNFDTAGVNLYQELIKEYAKGRLVIVSSNDEVEYKFCEERIDIMKYKV